MAKKIKENVESTVDANVSVEEEIKETKVDEAADIKETKVDEPADITAIVSCPLLNLREKADINSKALAVLEKGTKVKIIGECKEFYNVTVNGLTGYCVKEFIK